MHLRAEETKNKENGPEERPEALDRKDEETNDEADDRYQFVELNTSSWPPHQDLGDIG